MPYKDPERKRLWEQEHREIRNAQRRQRRLEMSSGPIIPQRAPDPTSEQKSGSGWKMLAALAVGVGIAVVGAFAGVKLPNPGRGQ